MEYSKLQNRGFLFKNTIQFIGLCDVSAQSAVKNNEIVIQFHPEPWGPEQEL